jgi:hypothetical protein
MTVIVEKSDIPSTSVTIGFSRYRNQKVIYWGKDRLITFDAYVRKRYVPIGSEKVMLITKGIEYRPDLVSYDIYGLVDIWWKILEANKMKDIWEFKSGKTIILPLLA